MEVDPHDRVTVIESQPVLMWTVTMRPSGFRRSQHRHGSRAACLSARVRRGLQALGLSSPLPSSALSW